MIYPPAWLKLNIVVANQPFIIRTDSGDQTNRVDFSRTIEKIQWSERMA
jgi:hypothetical protein